MNVALFGSQVFPWENGTSKTPGWMKPHRLVEADKKAYAQVDVIGEDRLLDARCRKYPDYARGVSGFDFEDLEFVETRAGRQPPPVEQAALVKIQAALESERCASTAQLSPEEQEAMAAQNLWTSPPGYGGRGGRVGAARRLAFGARVPGSGLHFFPDRGRKGELGRGNPPRRHGLGSRRRDSFRTFKRDLSGLRSISYADFIETGGETQAKRAGKQRLETKAYVMQRDFDLTNFRFNK